MPSFSTISFSKKWEYLRLITLFKINLIIPKKKKKKTKTKQKQNKNKTKEKKNKNKTNKTKQNRTKQTNKQAYTIYTIWQTILDFHYQ